jgi:hypothetical protein
VARKNAHRPLEEYYSLENNSSRQERTLKKKKKSIKNWQNRVLHIERAATPMIHQTGVKTEMFNAVRARCLVNASS